MSLSGHSKNCLCADTRRQFLWQTGAGFAGVALSALLDGDGFFSHASAAEPVNLLAPKAPHRPTKVKSCIFLFMYGGPSQMDLFDYKPELQRHDGLGLTHRNYIISQRIL